MLYHKKSGLFQDLTFRNKTMLSSYLNHKRKYIISVGAEHNNLIKFNSFMIKILSNIAIKDKF